MALTVPCVSRRSCCYQASKLNASKVSVRRRLQLQARKPAWATPSSSSSGSSTSSRLQQVLQAVDELNSKDPRTTTWQGQTLPYELAYSKWLTHWVKQLEPEPSEELQIVARGQHVERWKSPRSSYPEGRAGYLKWREDLKKSHSSTVVGLMEEAGYPPESCEKVRKSMLKQDLKKNHETQVLEDALCLVFLEHQFTDLINKEGPDKMVDIVKKTWGKMSQQGRDAALKLSLAEEELAVVQRALQT